MSSIMSLMVAGTMLACACAAAGAEDLLLDSRPGEALIGPVPVQQNVRGVALQGRGSAFFTVKRNSDQLQIAVRFVGDLADVQRRFGDLVATVPLPNDDCNQVVRINTTGLAVGGDGSTAIATLSGNVEQWVCIGPIKTKVEDSFDATLPLTLEVVEPHTVGLKLGDGFSVRLGGALGNLMDLLRGVAGINVNDRLKEAVEGFITPMRATLPADLLSLDPVIKSATFASNSGVLALTMQMSVSLDARAVSELLQALLRAPQARTQQPPPGALPSSR